MSDCFSEGANVFDAKNQVIVDQEPGAARAMERWQKAWKAELVNPEVLTKTSSTDTHRLFWTGRYAYTTTHSYYLKSSAGEPENSKLAPKKAKMAMYPGTGQSYMWTDGYTINAKSKNLEEAWKLARFLGGNLNGDWYVQRQWCLIAGLDKGGTFHALDRANRRGRVGDQLTPGSAFGGTAAISPPNALPGVSWVSHTTSPVSRSRAW